ncbi:MAG TPA: Ig-like domain-containing protein [Myxococcota bacterium]|nr:Ig-like domain-containing protein [Myxococcota bacterium]HRY95354.1 Ig-like domain-containing protein [Myxococcota bacterium]HSA21197.1 Ig-like domain-containing protein [Myxococcota bacterium]
MRAALLPGLMLAACVLCACGEGEEQPTPDLAPPAILRSEPVGGATGVALDVVVRVWLDEPFDNSRISADHMYLRQGATPLWGSLSRDTAQAMLALDLSVPLEAGATYEVVLSPGVCDLAPTPNCTDEPLTFSFQTAP